MRARSAFKRARRYFFLSFFGTSSSFSASFDVVDARLADRVDLPEDFAARSSITSSVISSSLKMTSSRMVRSPARS